jgi:hypothetical protein
MDSFTLETNQLRTIIVDFGGVTGLEQPGRTFDSLDADPSAMRKEQEHCYHSAV